MDDLIDRALAEDVGDGDATTLATVGADVRGRATITQKAPGVISGLDPAEAVFRRLDPAIELTRLGPEGVWREAGAPVLRAEGSARALLTGERTALNFLGRLSGVATRTARVVGSLPSGAARILDTRKTTPGMRMLEKRAVADGGGVNHRIGLYDFILIKENHAALAGGVGEAVRRARAARPDLGLAVEVRSKRRAFDPGHDHEKRLERLEGIEDADDSRMLELHERARFANERFGTRR